MWGLLASRCLAFGASVDLFRSSRNDWTAADDERQWGAALQLLGGRSTFALAVSIGEPAFMNDLDQWVTTCPHPHTTPSIDSAILAIDRSV